MTADKPAASQVLWTNRAMNTPTWKTMDNACDTNQGSRKALRPLAAPTTSKMSITRLMTATVIITANTPITTPKQKTEKTKNEKWKMKKKWATHIV